MVTFHIIEATQLHSSIDAEQFVDSSHRRYRFVSEESDICAKAATKSDDDLDTGSVSDDVFISSKPLYVRLIYCSNDRCIVHMSTVSSSSSS